MHADCVQGKRNLRGGFDMAAVTSIEVAAEGAKNSDVFESLKRPARNQLINGQWVPAKSGRALAAENPV